MHSPALGGAAGAHRNGAALSKAAAHPTNFGCATSTTSAPWLPTVSDGGACGPVTRHTAQIFREDGGGERSITRVPSPQRWQRGPFFQAQCTRCLEFRSPHRAHSTGPVMNGTLAPHSARFARWAAPTWGRPLVNTLVRDADGLNLRAGPAAKLHRRSARPCAAPSAASSRPVAARGLGAVASL